MDTEKRLGKAEALLTLAVDFLDVHAKENSGSSIVSKRIKEFLNNDSPFGLTYLYIHPYTGDEKIKTIKEVRTITGMGLKESKDLVEQGGVIMEGLPLQFARYAAVVISRWGANVEVKEGLIA